MPPPLSIAAAAIALHQGAVLACPTEAVWGLGCDPFDEAAVLRLLAIKQRAVDKGLILVAASIAQFDGLADWTALPAGRIAEVRDSWPGPNTWIVPVTPRVPAWITGAHDGVALRVSAHPVVAALCEAFGGPLVSTSANHAGAPPPRTLAELDPLLLDALDGRVTGETGARDRPSDIRDARSGAVLRSLAAIALATAAAMACLPAPAHAQARQVVIYRCTDAAGNLTVQNDVACPAGTRQQRQVVDVPPALPAYVLHEQRMPPVVANEEARAGAAIEQALPEPARVAERGPPPALFQCSTWDNAVYFTEETTPRESCVPLQVVGLDGNSRPAASACEQVADQCAAVPTETLCRAWKRRMDEAEFRWKFAGAKADDERKLEYEMLAAVYANSTCNR